VAGNPITIDESFMTIDVFLFLNIIFHNNFSDFPTYSVLAIIEIVVLLAFTLIVFIGAKHIYALQSTSCFFVLFFSLSYFSCSKR